MKTKGILKWLLMIAVVFAVGCEKEENSIGKEFENPLFEVSFSDIPTKSYVDGELNLLWHNQDQVSVFHKQAVNDKYEFAGETGSASGNLNLVAAGTVAGESLQANYAVYPYSSSAAMHNGTIVVDMPQVQNYSEKSFGRGANTMVAVTSGVDDYSLKFKNVGGYLKFKFYGGQVTVKSIELKGNDGEKISGASTIVAGYNQSPSLVMSSEAAETVTLDCGENGVVIGASEASATEFWFVLPPTDFKKGFTVTITDIYDRVMTKSTTAGLKIERNSVESMSPLKLVMLPDICGVWDCSEVHYNLAGNPSYDVYTMTVNKDGTVIYSDASDIVRSSWNIYEDGSVGFDIVDIATQHQSSGKIWYGTVNNMMYPTEITGATYRWNANANISSETSHYQFTMTRRENQ